MRMPFVVFSAFVVTSLTLAQQQGNDAGVKSLVNTERTFARTSVEKGMRQAFLEFLAEDGVVFRPGPVNGKKVYRERPDSRAALLWEPGYADVSAAGDLGYTTGPWELREGTPQGRPLAFGEFVSVWKRQLDGSWRVALDVGIDHPRPDSSRTHLMSYPDTGQWRDRSRGSQPAAEGGFTVLKSRERELSDSGRAVGMTALLRFADSTVRVFRVGRFASVGIDSVRLFLAGRRGSVAWEADSVFVARSGDLGYAYGRYSVQVTESGKAVGDTGYFVRIWKWFPGDKWRVVLDLLSPESREGS